MLINRQKCLYYFLEKTKTCSKLNLAKIFFTLAKEGNMDFKFYSFFPYKFGPYSFELFHDIEKLEQENIIKTDEKQIKLNKESKIKLNDKTSKQIDYFINRFSNKTDREIINYVYDKYPEYTIFSKIEKRKKYNLDQTGVLTIGYEERSIDEFLNKLVQNKVEYLIDIRNNPWSMKYGYKKYQLKTLTDKIDIKYISIPELGISPNLRKHLENKEDYVKLLKAYSEELHLKEKQLNYLIKLSKEHKIALMCFEKNSEICHRSVIGQKLQKMGVEVTLN